MKRIAVIFLILMTCKLSFGEVKMSMLKEWKFSETIYGTVWHSLVDEDGELIVAFFKTGLRFITPKKMTVLAPFGKGPNEIENFTAISFYKDGIAVLDHLRRAKVFPKIDGKYTAKNYIWFKTEGKTAIAPTAAVYSNEKWFLAGFGELQSKGGFERYFQLDIFDSSLKSIKRLFPFKTRNKNNLYQFIRHQCVSFGDSVFVLRENEPDLMVVSSDNIERTKTLPLEMPDFYKKMPGDFYLQKNDDALNPRQLLLDLEKWQTSYSRITKAVTDDDQLILSVRTCSDKLKKFAILFFNTKTFKLEDIFYTDDFLLAAKDGEYFFYANGEPSLDDNTDTCIIKVFRKKVAR